MIYELGQLARLSTLATGIRHASEQKTKIARMSLIRPAAFRLLFLALGFAACATFSASASAEDIYGFLDDHGVAHFASEPLDARYKIFFRAGQSFDTSDGLSAPRSATASRAPPRAPGAAAQTLLNLFKASPGYRPARTALTAAAREHGIDYALLQAVVATESGFDARAVSPKGALGLMQLMPATAERYGVRADRRRTQAAKLFDPQVNIAAGARYLADLMQRFSGQLDLALAAYNAGPGAVDQAGGKVPPYRETQNYVKTVLQLYAYLKPDAAGVGGVAPTRGARVPARIRMQIGGAIGRGNLPPVELVMPPFPASDTSNSAAPAAVISTRPPSDADSVAADSADTSAS